jgi:cystathionine beta-lyase
MTSRSLKTRLQHPETSVPTGFRSLATPVFRGSTTLFDKAEAVKDTWNHDEVPYTYGSYGTPTTLELAARVAELEGGRKCFITPGGQAALTLVYLAYLSSGEHVLLPTTIYGPSRAFADRVLRRLGIEVEYYDPDAGETILSRIRPHTRLVWCESPGSITMEVQDVPAIAAAAHTRGVTVALDNTWAAGVLFKPFDHGVDVSVQALTKYVGGHSDVLLGSATVCNEAHYERLGVTLQDLGMSASPDDCSLALRGLQTLSVRLQAIETSALRVASWLAARAEVEAVLHPALPSCPGHELWKRDFAGSSGLFSVVFRDPMARRELQDAMNRLTLFSMGYSWGGCSSLVAMPNTTAAPNAQRFGDRLLRFYVALEDPEDLIADLQQAFRFR